MQAAHNENGKLAPEPVAGQGDQERSPDASENSRNTQETNELMTSQHNKIKSTNCLESNFIVSEGRAKLELEVRVGAGAGSSSEDQNEGEQSDELPSSRSASGSSRAPESEGEASNLREDNQAKAGAKMGQDFEGFSSNDSTTTTTNDDDDSSTTTSTDDELPNGDPDDVDADPDPDCHDSGTSTRADGQRGDRRASSCGLKRRSSGCNCDQLANRIDHDGLPVTDVDLVSYKELCQMEQQAHHHQLYTYCGAKSTRHKSHTLNPHFRDQRLFCPAGPNSTCNGDCKFPTLTMGRRRVDRRAAVVNSSSSSCLALSSTGGSISRLKTIDNRANANKQMHANQRINHHENRHQMQTKSLNKQQLEQKQNNTHKRQFQFARRSSLQEESGAYYELCVSPEEQLIWQKYAWFPPSLTDLKQVDKFFDCFPREKIPFSTNSAAAAASADATQATETQAISSSPSLLVCRANSKQNASSSSHPAASSYRDEQISYQLARQDISLDYCSYPMAEKARAGYSQFVDQRNTSCLEVARVIEIERQLGPKTTSTLGSSLLTQLKKAPLTSLSQDQAQISLTSQPTNRQRRASIRELSEQSELALGSRNNPNQLVAERCRRCLVRFEHSEMAIAAPNFIIGSLGYQQASKELINIGQTKNYTNKLASCNISPCPNQEHHFNTPHTPRAHRMPNGNVALFHPQCFTCAQCKEFLVDLVYCLRDQKLLCLRHYGESVAPRCNWCQEVS